MQNPVFLFLVFILWAKSLAAEPPALEVFSSDSRYPLPENLPAKKQFTDSLSLMAHAEGLVEALHKKGYLKARTDSHLVQNNTHKVYIHPGPRFYWMLRRGNLSREVMAELRIGDLFNGNPLPFGDLDRIQQRVVEWYENHGYPFASVRADSIQIKEDRLSAALNVNTGAYIVFDSLRVKGDVAVSRGFLANHTGIRKGEPYSEKKAANLALRLEDLAFARLSQEPMVQFTEQDARVEVGLERRSANRFDGIAGLGSSPVDPEKLQVTGQLNLHLLNVLERGETFDMRWKGLGQGTQRLELFAEYPYLLTTPLSAGFKFSLHKQDTSWISLRRKPSFSYQTFRNTALRVFADIRSTELLNTSRFENATTLPAQIDSRTGFYGLEVSSRSAGFFAGFRDGYRAEISFAAGNRRIRQNQDLPPELYEGVEERQTQYTGTFSGIYRYPTGRRSSMVFGAETAGLWGKQLFETELFRIGGFNDLKGFDEASILSSFYGIFSAEWRYFTGEQSFFSLFFNAAYFEQRLKDSYQNGWPWGTGAGISLETAPGILSVFYALGKEPGIPLQFRNAKVHIGFISLF